MLVEIPEMQQLNAKYISGPTNSTFLKTSSATKFFAGGEETKFHIEAKVAGHPVSLVMRPYEDNIVQCWQAFREAGLPVVPTLRQTKIDNKTWLLATDVKADGSEVYGKGLRRTITENLSRERLPQPDVDRHFFELTSDQNFPDIVTQANRFSHLASQKRLILPPDDALELLIRPDGSWKLIILDLKDGVVLSKDEVTEYPNSLEQVNAGNAKRFLDNLTCLRKVLR